MQSVLPEYRYKVEGGRAGRHEHILRQVGDDPNMMMNHASYQYNSNTTNTRTAVTDRVRITSPPPMNFHTMSGTMPPNVLVPVQGDAMAVAELDQYRRAVRRMGEDILALRRELAGVSTENQRLANQLAHYDDLTRTVVSTQVIEGLSKAELADRYVASRQQLIQQEEQMQQYKQRVQKLQNEIIRVGFKLFDFDLVIIVF